MTVLHIFTEELSAKRLLDVVIPKVIPVNTYHRVYPHQGKEDLEKALKNTLPTISRTPGSRIIIMRDQDTGECEEVKRNIQEIIGLNCQCEYLVRIACKELESWYLGDLNALQFAYPRFKPDQYQNRSVLRNVDNINFPDRYLLQIIPEFRNRAYLPKIEVAESIGPHLDINNNRSHSFNHFIQAVRRLTESSSGKFRQDPET